jgi:hypothetical protein
MKELVVILVGAAIGVILTFLFWLLRRPFQSPLGTMAVGSASLVQAVLVILVIWISFGLQQGSQYTFHQYYNGVETGVEMIPHSCDTNSGCHYTYERSYTYYTTDSEGHTHAHTEYYDDPYFTEEDSWIIHTTVGDITLTDHALPLHWHPGNAYTEHDEVSMGDLQAAARNAGVGEPAEALDAEHALAIGDPRPATILSSYTNFIEGTGASSGLTAVSDKVDFYQKQGMLPPIVGDVQQGDQANKVTFVNIAPGPFLVTSAEFEQAVARLNMEAGSIHPVSSRFDIQVVIVNDARVPALESQVYTNALNAYWESSVFADGALPKNMAVIVIGTNGQTVTWAYGFTLINTADHVLWNELAQPAPVGLVGLPMDPKTLIGWPHAIVEHGVFQKVVPGTGALEHLLLFSPHHYIRQPMTNNQGQQGYNFLDTGPSLAFCFWMLLLAWVLGAIATNIWYTLVLS